MLDAVLTPSQYAKATPASQTIEASAEAGHDPRSRLRCCHMVVPRRFLASLRVAEPRRLAAVTMAVLFSLVVLACPLSGEASGPPSEATRVRPAHVTEQLPNSRGNRDNDPCCKFLAQAGASVQSHVARLAVTRTWTVVPTDLSSAPTLPAFNEVATKLLYFANGPPRPGVSLLASVWPHAPPADRI